MTLLEEYRAQLKVCQDKGLIYEAGHYETKVDFGEKDFYVSPDGGDVVRYKFNITGCLKTRIIKKEGKTKVLQFHKDRLPVYGRICNKKRLKGFLYKYLLFLRCDGIDDSDLIRLYILHCLTYKFEFWRRLPVKTYGEDGQIVVEYKDWELYDPDYSDIEKMIEGLLVSAMKVEIDDHTRDQFVVKTRCVVRNEVRTECGGYRNKTRNEIHRDARKGCRAATDNRIRACYSPELTEEELARKAGVSVGRIREWKADHRDELESLRDRISRMYDESLSPGKNAEIIGCSVNSVRKYAARLKKEETKEKKEETDDEWIERILEKQSAFWKDVPTAKHKDSDELDEMMDLIKDLD